MNKAKRARLEELIEEATVDCHDEDERHAGLLTMVEDNVDCPFRAKLIGEEVEVTGFEWPKSGYGLLAVCERGGKEHLVDITSLEWVKPYPEGYEWIEVTCCGKDISNKRLSEAIIMSHWYWGYYQPKPRIKRRRNGQEPEAQTSPQFDRGGYD